MTQFLWSWDGTTANAAHSPLPRRSKHSRKGLGRHNRVDLQEPPYLASGPKILQDMLTAYGAGAKYVIVFNYSNSTENPKQTHMASLTQEHFAAMENSGITFKLTPERFMEKWTGRWLLFSRKITGGA